MEFGRLSKDQLDHLSLTLPADTSLTKTVLSTAGASSFRFHLGLTNWGFKEWVGRLYPPQIKEKDFLQFYARQFNAIELNATHYKLYGSQTLTKWKQLTPPGFTFCPKMLNEITHKGSLMGKRSLLEQVLESLITFEDRLGPIFIQLSESFGPQRKEELFDFLSHLPKSFTFFLEVRQPDWFTSTELFGYLHELGIGAVITDTAGRRDCVHMHLTIPRAFIRFVANDQHPSDFTRIDEWAYRFRSWIDQGVEEISFFIHSPNEGKVLEIAAYAIEQFNEVCHAKLKPLQLGGYTLF